jgi:hypothetical protein
MVWSRGLRDPIVWACPDPDNDVELIVEPRDVLCAQPFIAWLYPLQSDGASANHSLSDSFRRLSVVIKVLELGDPVALFSNQDMSNLVSHQMKQALAAVQQIPADAFLNTPTEDIVSDLTEKYSFTPPTLRRADAYIDGPHEIEIRLPDYGREVRLRGTLLALIVPFDGEGMFYVNPGRWGGAIRGNLHNNNLVLTVRGENLQTAQVNQQFNVRIDEIEEYLGYQRAMADAHRQNLPPRLRPEIEARKQKLLDARQMVSGLAFPIRARPDAPKTFVAPIVRRTLPAASRKATEPFNPEPVLDDANYEHILSVIDNMAHVMERSPSAFVDSGEEALRQHFLVQLNGHYQGAATGETFNFTGKTDILIRVNGKNIFVAECKFWQARKCLQKRSISYSAISVGAIPKLRSLSSTVTVTYLPCFKLFKKPHQSTLI